MAAGRTVTGLWALLPLLILHAQGCRRATKKDCPVYRQARRVAPWPGDVVVARVNGRPILASEVRHRASQGGLTAAEAAEQLIDDELAVQEAERLGLHQEPAVVEAGKRAAIYKLLAETFEKSYTPDSVPDSELRRIYDRESPRWFKRPELRRFGHAYLTRPWSKRGRRWYLDMEKDRVLKRIMQNFQELVARKRPRSWEAFSALATDFDQGNQHLALGKGLQAHRDLRRPFADALFALEHPGDISGVIETRPWYHVAYLIEVIPRKSISFPQAKEEIRAKLFPHAQKKAFTRWVKRLERQCTIRARPEHLPVGESATGPAPEGTR